MQRLSISTNVHAVDYIHSIQIMSRLQIIFLFMPLFYLFFLVVRGLFRMITERIKHKHVHVDTPDHERTDSLLFEERETKDTAYSIVNY